MKNILIRHLNLSFLKLSLACSLLLALPTQAQENTAPENNDTSKNRQATMIVLDGSNSMWAQVDGINKIVTARESLKDVLEAADDSIEFGLLVYGNRRKRQGCTDITLVSKPEDYDQKTMIKQVYKIKPFGRSPIASALEAAAARLKDRPHSRILLVSDGEESCERDPCATAAQLIEENPSLQIDVMGFQESKEAQLECIAENGRGAFVFAEDKKRLQTLLASAKAPAVQTTLSRPNAPPSSRMMDENIPGSVELSLKANDIASGALLANYFVYDMNGLIVANFTARRHVKEYLKPGTYRVKVVWKNYSAAKTLTIHSGENVPHTFDVGPIGQLKLSATNKQGKPIPASYAIYAQNDEFISRYVMLDEVKEQLPTGQFRIRATLGNDLEEAEVTIRPKQESQHIFSFEQK
ncbi:MAG: hypothetical protein CR991_09730 [Proteobacteria bacterium]|nr:MAG: hypothetical protein CR991_09730 [Pseudomonadota bacterium]